MNNYMFFPKFSNQNDYLLSANNTFKVGNECSTFTEFIMSIYNSSCSYFQANYKK